MKQKEKDDLCLLSVVSGCSLDTMPAVVVGRQLDFAIVRTEEKDIEFSWQAVSRILNSKRCFKS